jgi:hypothetical protein
MTGTLVKRDNLRADQRAAMLHLLAAHFCNVSHEQFDADLEEKNWAILLQNDTGRLVGFSTILFYSTVFEGHPIAVVYSGDTIVERSAWGSPILPRTWVNSVWQIHRQAFPVLPLYWLLITSGYRTYRFLPVFWKDFYPRHDAPTPPFQSRLIAHLAQARFGPLYDSSRGIVRLRQPLQPDLIDIDPGKLTDPHIAFFLERNPGYISGDELVCIAELSPENLTAAGCRMVRPRPVLVETH